VGIAGVPEMAIHETISMLIVKGIKARGFIGAKISRVDFIGN
jgi:hypothetical protein